MQKVPKPEDSSRLKQMKQPFAPCVESQEQEMQYREQIRRSFRQQIRRIVHSRAIAAETFVVISSVYYLELGCMPADQERIRSHFCYNPFGRASETLVSAKLLRSWRRRKLQVRMLPFHATSSSSNALIHVVKLGFACGTEP